jgi:hypothetical protein
LANPNLILVIAPRGEMALVPVGMTPFLLEIESGEESSVQEIFRAPNDAANQKARQYLLIRLIRDLIQRGKNWYP